MRLPAARPGGASGGRRFTTTTAAAVATTLAAALAAAGCADTVNPRMGGLRLGVESGPLRPPVLLDGEDVFEFPDDAWTRGAAGTTVLKLRISQEGVVDSVLVLASCGHEDLDSAAVANAHRLRYRPAEQGGDPIEVWGRLPVIYPAPKEAGADVP
ncbi:MAG: energy transducer TonB [Gemmatimonadota bacterium]